MLQEECSPERLETEIQRVKDYKPPIGKVLDSFGKVLLTRAKLKKELVENSRAEDPDMSRFTAGVPVLSGLEISKWFSEIDKGFLRMLEAVKEAFPGLEKEAGAVGDYVAENPDEPGDWMNAVLEGRTALFRELGDKLDVEAETVRFVLEQCLKPFFEACAAHMAPQVEKVRWDKGYCPVCGAYPDSTYLKKGKEEFDYLVAHGGQRWMHCSLCSYEWRLRRMVCPYCANEEAESLEYFQAEDMGHERFYACNKCKRYVTCIDVSELVDVPPGDLLPFELLHLDLIAQQKGYKPMAWGVWNAMED